jgi:long-chain acyl-CoA synthetase
MVRDPDLETEVRRAVSAANTRVSQAESIRALRILPVAFTEEQGLITPSRKLRRKVIEEVFAGEIEAIYART